MTQRHDTSIHELDEKNLYAPSLRDDELLPLITRKPKSNTTDRASLGLAQARANGGSLALHDELGEQLADVSCSVVIDGCVRPKPLLLILGI